MLAVIFYTGTHVSGCLYNKRDDGLLSFDGTYNDDGVRRLRHPDRGQRPSGSHRRRAATLISNVELTRARDGGVGYNVLGAIPAPTGGRVRHLHGSP